MMMGISELARNRRQIDSPSSPGSMRSSTIRLIRVSASTRSMARPLSAMETRISLALRNLATSRPMSLSSSTTRMWGEVMGLSYGTPPRWRNSPEVYRWVSARDRLLRVAVRQQGLDVAVDRVERRLVDEHRRDRRILHRRLDQARGVAAGELLVRALARHRVDGDGKREVGAPGCPVADGRTRRHADRGGIGIAGRKALIGLRGIVGVEIAVGARVFLAVDRIIERPHQGGRGRAIVEVGRLGGEGGGGYRNQQRDQV